MIITFSQCFHQTLSRYILSTVGMEAVAGDMTTDTEAMEVTMLTVVAAAMVEDLVGRESVMKGMAVVTANTRSDNELFTLSTMCERENSVKKEKDACQNKGFLLFPQCFYRDLFCMA